VSEPSRDRRIYDALLAKARDKGITSDERQSFAAKAAEIRQRIQAADPHAASPVDEMLQKGVPMRKRAAPKNGWEAPEPDREPSVMPVGGKRQMSELQIFCIIIGGIGCGSIAIIGLLISLKATGVFVPLALIGLGAAVLLNDRRSF